jgi:hypothetical protein
MEWFIGPHDIYLLASIVTIGIADSIRKLSPKDTRTTVLGYVLMFGAAVQPFIWIDGWCPLGCTDSRLLAAQDIKLFIYTVGTIIALSAIYINRKLRESRDTTVYMRRTKIFLVIAVTLFAIEFFLWAIAKYVMTVSVL